MLGVLVVFGLQLVVVLYWFGRGRRRFGLKGIWWWIASAFIFLVLGALSRFILAFS